MTSENNVPRRIRVDLFTPAELAIRAAVHAVEDVGADVRLTKASILLQQAQAKVADFVDGISDEDGYPRVAPDLPTQLERLERALDEKHAKLVEVADKMREYRAALEDKRVARWHATYNAAMTGLCVPVDHRPSYPHGLAFNNEELDQQAHAIADRAHGHLKETPHE